MLEVKNLTKKFGNLTALDDLSFTAENGEIFGIIGRNGAGKSTTFRIILKIIEQTKGEVLYNGEKITEKTLDKIGYLPEEGSLIPTYTVQELCEYYGGLKLIKPEEIHSRLTMWLEEFHISEYMNNKIKNLSKGNRQKIQFIISVLHNPELLILDEPFSGLDPISVEELKSAILKLKNEGKTIIFSSHRMEHIESLCKNIVIIEKGKTLLKGNLSEILDTYEIDGVKGGHNLNDIFISKVGASNEQ
jgi:ABC-2 type transport system ATP-binding protein